MLGCVRPRIAIAPQCRAGRRLALALRNQAARRRAIAVPGAATPGESTPSLIQFFPRKTPFPAIPPLAEPAQRPVVQPLAHQLLVALVE